MAFTNLNKSSAPSFSNVSKNVSTFLNFLRHGKKPLVGGLGELLADYTFESVVFLDGTQLKNVTFEQLTDIVWTNVSKS